MTNHQLKRRKSIWTGAAGAILTFTFLCFLSGQAGHITGYQ